MVLSCVLKINYKFNNYYISTKLFNYYSTFSLNNALKGCYFLLPLRLVLK